MYSAVYTSVRNVILSILISQMNFCTMEMILASQNWHNLSNYYYPQLIIFSHFPIVTTIQYTVFSLTPWGFLMWLWLGLREKICFLTKKNSVKRTLTLAQYEEAVDANFVLVLIGEKHALKNKCVFATFFNIKKS